jgi:hypothetical protein
MEEVVTDSILCAQEKNDTNMRPETRQKKSERKRWRQSRVEERMGGETTCKKRAMAKRLTCWLPRASGTVF